MTESCRPAANVTAMLAVIARPTVITIPAIPSVLAMNTTRTTARILSVATPAILAALPIQLSRRTINRILIACVKILTVHWAWFVLCPGQRATQAI